MDKFLENTTYQNSLKKIIGNMNSSISIIEIKFVVRHLFTKRIWGIDAFTGKFFTNLQKTEEKETVLNRLYETNATLKPKQAKKKKTRKDCYILYPSLTWLQKS